MTNIQYSWTVVVHCLQRVLSSTVHYMWLMLKWRFVAAIYNFVAADEHKLTLDVGDAVNIICQSEGAYLVFAVDLNAWIFFTHHTVNMFCCCVWFSAVVLVLASYIAAAVVCYVVYITFKTWLVTLLCFWLPSTIPSFHLMLHLISDVVWDRRS